MKSNKETQKKSRKPKYNEEPKQRKLKGNKET